MSKNLFDIFDLECDGCGSLKDECVCDQIASHRVWAAKVNAEWDQTQAKYFELTGEYLPDPADKVHKEIALEGQGDDQD